MEPPPTIPSDVAFTPAVKALQSLNGSRRAYERMEQRGGWATTISEDLAAFIALQTSVFLATANALGQPYIQHRGGPAGFLRVLDGKTLGFVDLPGNRQFITWGNLQENPKVCLFLIDYVQRQRVKIWGEARVVEGDAELLARLAPTAQTRAERAIIIAVSTLDHNCPQYIPQRFEAEAVTAALADRDQRIAELEGELAELRSNGRDDVQPPVTSRAEPTK